MPESFNQSVVALRAAPISRKDFHMRQHPLAQTSPPAANARRVPISFLIFTILCTGSGIIMLEVLGARIAGPIFGVSLYIWTALITITLASLSIGYWVGGKVADRRPEASVMYWIILAAGIWIALLPLVNSSVLVWAYQIMGIKAGVLIGSAILFAVPLTLLGMVSPFAIKLALADLSRAGQTAGLLYSISTIGSVAGTIIAGYVLIPGIGVNKTLLVITVLILAPPVVWFALVRRWRTLAAAAVVLMVGLSSAWPLSQHELPMGWDVLEKRDSQYSQIKVLDINAEKDPTRWLMLEGTSQTGIYKNSNEIVSPYVELMTRFLRTHRTSGTDVLLVGLGGGSLLKPMKDMGYTVDVVEIDPAVAEAAEKYFGVDRRWYRLLTEDGRAYIRRSAKKYDIVLLDVFSGGGQPFHLFSKESFEDIRRILKPGGYLGMNAIAYPEGPNAQMTRSIVKTAGAVFSHARTFIGDPQDPKNEIQNVLLFFAEKDFAEIAREQATAQQLEDQQWLKEHVEKINGNEGFLITDDWNPVDLWTAKVNEAWRKNLYQGFGAKVLAY